MKNEELVSIINAYRKDSLGVDDGELTNQRADSLDHYHGRPYGDEKEGRSAVVSKDLAETVEWMMPAVMKVFVSSGNIAEFQPESQEDEDRALQESDATNQVIMKDNDGFLVIYDATKDALILKNGYFKHYWDETDETTEEEYHGLSEIELAQLMMALEQQGTVKVAEQESEVIVIDGQEIPIYNVKLKIKRTKGKCVVEAVPVEEVRVSKRCRGSLQTSPFTEHVTRKTRSDLVEMGMPKSFVYDLPSMSTDEDGDSVKYARDSINDENEDYIGVNYDRSMDEIEFCEAYIRVDYDNDGIAELRKVVTVANKIPPGDEWNEVIDAVPLTGMVPKRVPHRHVGESLDDDLEDLQRIKTILTRQLLDNVYLTNNQELIINERAHVPDFLRRLPGGLKRVEGEGDVQGAAMPVPVSPILNQILPAIDYIDGVKSNRTGIDKSTTGLDPDLLKQTTKGAYMENLNRASQKVEMIIRMLAETGIKELVKQVHRILLKHQDKPRVMQLRGKYVNVDPREWKERNNLTVKVGIGTGSQEEKREKYMILGALQEKLIAMGAASPAHGINLFQDIAKAMDFDMPEKYAFSPQEFGQMMQKRAQQPQQADPYIEGEKIKGQVKVQIEQMQQQAKAQEAENQRRFDAAFKQQEMQYKQIIEQITKRTEHEHKMHELMSDMQKFYDELRSKEGIAILNGEVQLAKEGMKKDIGKPGMGAELSES